MFRNRNFERVHQMFEDQFDPDGADFLYRKGMKAAPIRVTAAERDGFVADFKRHMRYGLWGLMLATILLIFGIALLGPDPDSPRGTYFLWGGLMVLLAPFLLVYHRAWTAPVRVLERRPLVGVARSRAEVGKAMLARTSYGQLALIPILALVIGAKAFDKNGVIVGWSLIWLLLAGVLLATATIQAFRKWNSQRD